MSAELSKRIITSLILFLLFSISFLNFYILILSLIIILVITFQEASYLISKIYQNKNSILKIIIKIIIFFYLVIFSLLIFYGVTDIEINLKKNLLFLFLACISSDIGGLVIGKTFKGKKLTKISPNKTISGSIGSFIFSIFIAIIYYFIFKNFFNFFDLVIISLITSLACQIGDLLISYFKRKANVKNTGNILPGHGGILDRIDGMLLAIPIGILSWKLLI